MCGGKNIFLVYCMCRGDHWSPANWAQQRVFREGFFTGKRARASNARPYILCDGRLWVFDTLRPYYL